MTELNEQVKNQIDDVFARQQRYALELRKSDYKQRLAVLDRFEQAFRESEEKIYQSAADDFSKPQAEVDMSEIMAVLAELKHVRKNLKKWMKPVSVMPTASMIGTSSKIVKEPKGVTLVVSPWNYPFNLTFGLLERESGTGFFLGFKFLFYSLYTILLGDLETDFPAL